MMKYRDKPRETNLSFIFPFVLYTRSHIARTDGNDWKSLWYPTREKREEQWSLCDHHDLVRHRC